MHWVTKSCFAGWVCLAVSAAVVTAQEPATDGKPVAGKPVEGTLTLGSKTHKLLQAVAYEVRRDGDRYISVLASDRKIPWDRIQAELKAQAGNDENLTLDQPYLVITFKPTGEPIWCRAGDGGGSFFRSGESLTGSAELKQQRVSGQFQLALQPDAVVKSAFDCRWDLTVGGAPATATPKLIGPVKASVTGKFLGNGKPAKLACVSARPGEPFADKPSIVIVLTEKDHSRDPRPAFKAGFGEYGSALIVSVFENGEVFGCEVAHAAHGKMPFSSSGSLRIAEFEAGEGRVSGEMTTDGEHDFFDKTWEIDLKFVAPFTAATTAPPTRGTPAPNAKPAAPKQPATRADDDDDDPEDPDDVDDAPAGPADGPAATASLKVKDLALPKDAAEIQYKKLVEQMSFRSGTAVAALADELSRKLGAQGWKADKSGDLVTPKSAILKRQRGKGQLTIFIKPADKGSQVMIMTEGLDWDGVK